MTPRNQDGTAPWSVVSDVTIRYNIVRHAGGGINVTGSDTNYPSHQGRNIRIETQSLLRRRTSRGRAVTLIWEQPCVVTLEHNTTFRPAASCSCTARTDGSFDTVAGFRFANNLALHNERYLW